MRHVLGSLFVASLCSSALAQTTKPGAPPLPDLKPIMSSVEDLRELKFKRDVPAKHQSVEDWDRYLRGELEKYYPPDKRDGVQAGLLRLGMLREPIDLGEELASALTSQAAAYYDPDSGAFYYLVVDMPMIDLQTTAAHELTHALQDQHFDLDRVMDLFEPPADGPRNEDVLLAVRFLIEGEATDVMMLYGAQAVGFDLRANRDMQLVRYRAMADMDLAMSVEMAKVRLLPGLDEDSPMRKAIEGMDKIPPYILYPLYTAYMKGAYFSMSLRHAGGWAAVDAAHRNLPRSTEQTLHPEKFLAEKPDEPTVIPYERPAALGMEWKQIDAAIHGEYYLALMLSNFDVPRHVAARATEGWDGDVYYAYRDDKGRVLIALATTWDSTDDADEFYETYRRALDTRYPKATARGARKDGYAFDTGDPKLGDGLIVHRGREVFVVEGADEALVAKVMDGLTAMPVVQR